MVVIRVEQIGSLKFPQVEPLPVRYEFQQRLVDQGPFGFDPAQLLGFSDEILIKFNVGAHFSTPQCVYVDVYNRRALERQWPNSPCDNWRVANQRSPTKMTISLYDATVASFLRQLETTSGFLDKCPLRGRGR